MCNKCVTHIKYDFLLSQHGELPFDESLPFQLAFGRKWKKSYGDIFIQMQKNLGDNLSVDHARNAPSLLSIGITLHFFRGLNSIIRGNFFFHYEDLGLVRWKQALILLKPAMEWTYVDFSDYPYFRPFKTLCPILSQKFISCPFLA